MRNGPKIISFRYFSSSRILVLGPVFTYTGHENVIQPRQPITESHLIPPYDTCFHKKTRVCRSSKRPGGSALPPPTIPGELSPPWDPCPSACEGGVHSCRGREMAHFSAAAENSCTYTVTRFSVSAYVFAHRDHDFAQKTGVSS